MVQYSVSASSGDAGASLRGFLLLLCVVIPAFAAAEPATESAPLPHGAVYAAPWVPAEKEFESLSAVVRYRLAHDPELERLRSVPPAASPADAGGQPVNPSTIEQTDILIEAGSVFAAQAPNEADVGAQLQAVIPVGTTKLTQAKHVLQERVDAPGARVERIWALATSPAPWLVMLQISPSDASHFSSSSLLGDTPAALEEIRHYVLAQPTQMPKQEITWYLESVGALKALQTQFGRTAKAVDPILLSSLYPPLSEERGRVMREFGAAINGRSYGLVLLVPELGVSWKNYPYRQFHEQVLAQAREWRIQVVDFLPLLSTFDSMTFQRGKGDKRPNEYALRVFAHILGAYLDCSQILRTPVKVKDRQSCRLQPASPSPTAAPKPASP